MIDWERSSDNKYCRELTCMWKLGYISFIYIKETSKLEIQTMSNNYNETNNVRKTPRIPINDLLWLMNGEN